MHIDNIIKKMADKKVKNNMRDIPVSTLKKIDFEISKQMSNKVVTSKFAFQKFMRISLVSIAVIGLLVGLVLLINYTKEPVKDMVVGQPTPDNKSEDVILTTPLDTPTPLNTPHVTPLPKSTPLVSTEQVLWKLPISSEKSQSMLTHAVDQTDWELEIGLDSFCISGNLLFIDNSFNNRIDIYEDSELLTFVNINENTQSFDMHYDEEQRHLKLLLHNYMEVEPAFLTYAHYYFDNDFNVLVYEEEQAPYGSFFDMNGFLLKESVPDFELPEESNTIFSEGSFSTILRHDSLALYAYYEISTSNFINTFKFVLCDTDILLGVTADAENCLIHGQPIVYASQGNKGLIDIYYLRLADDFVEVVKTNLLKLSDNTKLFPDEINAAPPQEEIFTPNIKAYKLNEDTKIVLDN